MSSSYKSRLEGLKGHEAIVHRASASDVNGKVHFVGEEGCIIKQPNDDGENALYVFIAFKDIRGVGNIQPNYES